MSQLTEEGYISRSHVSSGAVPLNRAYRHYVEGGWGSLQFDTKYGGQGVPFVVAASVQEMWHSANLSWGLCPLLTQGAVEAITHNASDELKQRYLPKLISGEWSGTMNLTESDAGTDVGALKTRATPEKDHYLIRGQKTYITWGEHDMTENIVHLVLARLPNAPQGVKGISLFLVPKILVNKDGSIYTVSTFSKSSLSSSSSPQKGQNLAL